MNRTLPALVDAAAARHGERTLLTVDGTRRTYAQTRAAAATMAGAPAARGWRPGDRIAALLSHRVELIDLVLGFVDRVKDCIRRRGENISSDEVEAALRAYPHVAGAAAFRRRWRGTVRRSFPRSWCRALWTWSRSCRSRRRARYARPCCGSGGGREDVGSVR
ncbi:hypothetical protein [Streptomyces sp. NPDC055060]